MNSEHDTLATDGNKDCTKQVRVYTALLYPYLANPALSYREWTSSLENLASDLHWMLKGHKLFHDDRGRQMMSLELAMFFIIRASITPNGAMARVILDEGLDAARNGDPQHINRLLGKYMMVGGIPGFVKATALHGFLDVNTTFSDWMSAHVRNMGLKYGEHYGHLSVSGGSLKIHGKESRSGETYFYAPAAEQIITSTRTPRGEQMAGYLQNPALRHAPC